jgi:hypothetical protein
MDFLRAVKEGDKKTVKHMLSSVPVQQLNAAIVHAAEYEEPEMLALLLSDPRGNPNEAAYKASEEGHEEIVLQLLQDPRIVPDNKLLRSAVRRSLPAVVAELLPNPAVNPEFGMLLTAIDNLDAEIVALLVASPRINAADDNNRAIYRATEYVHGEEVVAALLADPAVDPAARHNVPIHRAAYFGAVETVALLLQNPLVDPSDNDNSAIKAAAKAAHYGIPYERKLPLEKKTPVENFYVIIAMLMNDPRVRARGLPNPKRGDDYFPNILYLVLHRYVSQERALKRYFERAHGILTEYELLRQIMQYNPLYVKRTQHKKAPSPKQSKQARRSRRRPR